MLLSSIFEQLTHGEFSQLPIGGNIDNEGITDANYIPVLAHVNLGLIDLFTKFPLKMKAITVQQFDEVSTYYLDREYAVSNTVSTRPYKYIIDSTAFPFENTVLKIECIQDEAGEFLPFNQSNVANNITNPSYNSIQIASPSSDNAIGVTYRASHTILSADNLYPAQINVDMPLSLMKPLLLFVAHRAYATINEGITDSNNYLVKYEQACAEITKLNLINTNKMLNKKLENNGWA